MDIPYEFSCLRDKPTGFRIVGKSHWTGQGTLFPRPLIDEALDDDLASRAGVYILWGTDEAGGLPQAYVGESGNAAERLQNHSKYSQNDFWTKGMVFSSTDHSLNKAHVLHIEARLFQLAKDANRCRLMNTNQPALPALSQADRADAESFLSDLLMCLPIVGVNFFETVTATTDETNDLYFNEKGTDATGYESPEGFMVRKGSTSVGNQQVTESMAEGARKLRQDLIDEEVMQSQGDKYEFLTDYPFNSPSQAAGVLAGASYNGLDVWKDKNGDSLNTIRSSGDVT